MDPTDTNSLKVNTFDGDTVYKHGMEKFCNMQGQYVTIDATLTQAQSPFLIPLCNLGIMGTEYGRSSSLEVNVSVTIGSTKNVDIPKIESLLSIGNTLDIEISLRDAATYSSWVTIDSSMTKVTF